MDLPLKGATYTWTNNQDACVSNILDCLLLTLEWLGLNAVFSQEVLPNPGSDHTPILLRASNHSSGPRPFKLS